MYYLLFTINIQYVGQKLCQAFWICKATDSLPRTEIQTGLSNRQNSVHVIVKSSRFKNSDHIIYSVFFKIHSRHKLLENNLTQISWVMWGIISCTWFACFDWNPLGLNNHMKYPLMV